MKTFVTFGFNHIHKINNNLFNHDCVAVVNGDRKTVFSLFGDKFCFEYPEEHWNDESMKYYPRGYITANPKT